MLALLAAAVLGGCSSGGDSAAASSSGPPALQDIATKAGCGAITEDSEELYVREGGTCSAGGDELRVYTFSDGKSRDAWLQVAKGFGGVFVVGDRWVVSVDDQAAGDAVKARAGGEVQ